MPNVTPPPRLAALGPSASASTVCLLLVDLQSGLSKPGPDCLAPPLAAEAQARNILTTATRLQREAVAAGALVVQVRLAFDPNYRMRTNRTPRFDRYPSERLLKWDDEAAQIVPDLDCAEALVLNKSCVDPFIGTPLATVLSVNGIQDILVGGVATNLAVESAVRGAADRGFAPHVVEDICASFSPELHQLAVEHTLPLFTDVITSAEATRILQQHRAPTPAPQTEQRTSS
jgi:nicotinamidase-related amidase